MYQLGAVCFQRVHFGHFGQKCTRWGFFILSRYILAILGKYVPAGGCIFSAGTFWPFWVQMYELGVFYSQPAHFGHFGRTCTGWGFLFSAGTFWPFWAKMYRLGVFYSQPVHLGQFGPKCTGWGVFTLSQYILAILGKSVPAGHFLFSAGTFWPFWAKMFWLVVIYSQPVHFGHFGRKCTGWGFFILSRYSFSANLGENVLLLSKRWATRGETV